MSFLLGRNMSYFKEVLRLVEIYNKFDDEKRRKEMQKEKKIEKTRY